MGHYEKKQLTIMTTFKCNMDCKYCITFTRKAQRAKIDIDFAKSGIREYLSAGYNPWIRFYGAGECTMEMELIKDLIAYARRLSDRKIIFEIQTNGFFSESTADYIGNNFDLVYVSCDGPPTINDYYRKTRYGRGTSAVIERNIGNINKKTSLYVRSTVTKINLYKQKEIIDYFHQLGVSCVFSKPVLRKVDMKENSGLTVNLAEYAKEFISAHKYARKLGVYYGNIYVVNFDKPTKIFCRACGPYPHLTPDGYVTCCDRAYSGQTSLTALVYGRYDKQQKKIEYDHDKILRIRKRTVFNMKKCRNCTIKDYCGGSCIGTSTQYTGNMFVPDKRECEIIKYFYKRIGNIKNIPFHP